MSPLFERVTIAGVGLIGGSLALAARHAGLFGKVVGLGRSAANLAIARQRGMIDDATHDPQDAVRGSDLIVLAVPVASLAPVLRTMAPALRSDAVVTDVGSVKVAVLREIENALPDGVAFVGAHPIAGTEFSGAAAADAGIFQGRRCVLTPGTRSTPEATARIRDLWRGVGMEVHEMDAARHDEIFAWISHLPHAIAFSIIAALQYADASATEFAGPSFQSVTRVAASAPETWTDIFLANARAIEAAVAGFTAELSGLRDVIRAGDRERLREWLTRARASHSRSNSRGENS